MNEASVRLNLHHALQWRGFWPLHHQDARPCPKCRTIITPSVVGRPDTEARHTRFPIAMIEVKDLKETAFPFNEITPEQHKYLTSWIEEGGQSYLCLGKIVPMGTKETIHSIYVIPWLVWMEWEKSDTILGLKSIPYSYELYTNNAAKKSTDLVTRCRPEWQLIRDGPDWHFHDNHPLAVQDEVLPFYKRIKKKKE